MSSDKQYIIVCIHNPEQFHIHDNVFNIDAIVFVKDQASKYSFEDGCQKVHDLNAPLKKPFYGLIKYAHAKVTYIKKNV